MTPVFICWLYYPNDKAMVSGLNSAAYGLGAGLWTLLSTTLNNPDNVAPKATGKPYDEDVANNFPKSYRYECIIFLVLAGLVILLMPNYPADEKEKEEGDEEEPKLTTKQPK